MTTAETADVEDGAYVFHGALDQFYVDARNPRQRVEDDGIDELAANIAAFGVLSPLIVVHGSGGFGIIDGRRRFLALTRLAQQGAGLARIPALLCDQDDAEGLAIAANTARVALSPAQEARAFARMLDAAVDADAAEGPLQEPAAIAGIAKAFGVGVRHVEQRLKLAALHPPILQALDDGAIDLDTARVWTRADAVLQASVWEKLGPKAQKLAITQALDKKAMSGTGPIARFVGEARYVAAGGRIERDLFGEEGDALWLDRKIAEKLCAQLLDEEKARVEAEGWSVVETRRSPPGYGARTATVKVRKPDEAERAVIDGLKAEIKAAEKACQAEVDALGEDADWRAESSVQQRHERDIIEPLEAKLEAANEALMVYDAKLKAGHGAIVYLDDEGRLGVTRAVILEEKPAARTAGAPPAKASKGAAPKPPPERDLSHAAARMAAGVAGTVIGRAFAQHPKAALVALAADVARDAFNHHSPYSLTGFEHYGADDAPPLAGDKARETADHTWRERLKPFAKKAGALEAELLRWDIAAVVQLLAHCVGALLRPDGDEDAEDRAAHAALGRFCNVDPGLEWTPDVAFCKEMSEKALRAALFEMGVAPGATTSKAALAAMVADNAARLKWTPPLVREICGATFAAIPLPEGAAPEKRKPGPPKKAQGPGRTAGTPAGKSVKKKAKAAAKKPVAKKPVATKKTAPRKATAKAEAL